MNDRCYRRENKSFQDYGGRGITVCDLWRRDFAAFLSDMGYRPAGTSLDRIDVNGHYELGNVRWADRVTQARNVRDVRRILALGQARTLAEWADVTGIDKRKIHNRIHQLGWTPDRAVSEGAV